MKAHYLGHVVFYVREMKRSLAFYRNLLGFELVGEMKHPLNAVALTSGRTHHEILLIEVGAAPPPQKGHRLGLYHIGIKMGDSLDELRTVRNELNEAGVLISGMSDHTVSQSLYLEDPDGNEVELYVDDPSVDWKKDPAAVVATIKPLSLM
jgi:catechol 2,3-dioxygenase